MIDGAIGQTLAQMHFVPKILLIMLLALIATDYLMRHKIIEKIIADNFFIETEKAWASRFKLPAKILNFFPIWLLLKLLIKIIKLPLKIIKLPEEITPIYFASFGSTIAANINVAKLYEQKILNYHQVFIAAILNSTPAYWRMLFAYHIPVLIPIVGWKIGGMYLVCYMMAAFAKILYCSAASRFKIKNGAAPKEIDAATKSKRNKKCFIRKKITDVLHFIKIPEAVISPIVFFINIAFWFVLITFTVLFLVNAGYFNDISRFAAPLLDLAQLPEKLSIPLLTFISGHMVAGAGIIGALVKTGAVTEMQALACLVLGAIIGLPVFVLRQILPNYTAIFGWELGGKIALRAFLIAFAARIITFLFLIKFLI